MFQFVNVWVIIAYAILIAIICGAAYLFVLVFKKANKSDKTGKIKKNKDIKAVKTNKEKKSKSNSKDTVSDFSKARTTIGKRISFVSKSDEAFSNSDAPVDNIATKLGDNNADKILGIKSNEDKNQVIVATKGDAYPDDYYKRLKDQK